MNKAVSSNDHEDPRPLRDALEALTEGVAVFDRNMILVACNQRYVDQFPRAADVIVPGVHWDDMLTACLERGEYDDRFDDTQAFLNRASHHRVNFDRDVIAEHSDGRAYQVRFQPTSDGGHVVMRRDVTEHHAVDTMVHDRETLLATVMDTSPVAIVMSHLDDGKITYRSQEARAIFGETKFAVEHHPSKEAYETFIEALVRGDATGASHVTCQRKDGTTFEASFAGRIVEFTGRDFVVTALTDITEQLERDALIRQVLQACPAPIRMIYVDTGETLFCSPETQALFGDAVSIEDYYVDPADRDRYLQELYENGTVKEFKAQYYNRHRKPFWCAVSARLIRYNGRDAIVSHSRDLTEELKIEAELNSQREKIYQTEKMSALGELLAGVAHELNNPLSVVVGHSLMLREDTADPDVLRQVTKIGSAAERCAKIVKTFLSMARQQPSRTEEADINEIIQIAVDVARYGDLGNTLDITCDLSPDLPTCMADGDQVTQVVVNLLLNAAQAMHGSNTGDRVVVATRKNDQSGDIVITVEDNGPGIPKAQQSRVFEPFFTTKDVGNGTGIGLTLCHRIVLSHNGNIWIDKKFTDGTRFVIELPAHHEKRSGDQKEAQVPTHAPKAAKVLIVDDEIDVAELNAEILMRAGYEVDVANKAKRGIELLGSGPYDLILSDLNMPEIDGRGFFEAIKADFPHLINRIGFVTGDTMGTSSQTFLKEAKSPFLEKPVSPNELRSFVAGILQAAGGDA
ncbi:PAS-domain containing protein [Roseobacter sp. YSTF-M11]|uniref:histidine kinase n=1 Tax=Roseobacter insulae TaxID=2859783 RepID=A0A9X1K4S4_9RHOB|nr:ATP-binding protein [Roseobacter insulae]MBW4710007.1 PAS-domain containing protein [Roseobacter insulae]